MNDSEPSLRRSPVRSLTGVQIVGTGSYLPDNVVTNDDLAQLGFDADWIVQRTGIHARRHAPPSMTTSDMAVGAAERAIEAAGVPREEIDLVILATLSPDYLLPQTAAAVQDRLGLSCPAVDLSAACAGFTYALVTAAQFVASGCSRRALVIGADTNSRVMNPKDKKTFPLFGDGAGAVVLAPGSKEQGLLSYTLGADGSGAELLYRPMGGAKIAFDPNNRDELEPWFLFMDGKPVFKWAVSLLETTFRQVLDEQGRSFDDVKYWLLHQANERILDAAMKGLGIPAEKIVKHLDRYGNTSAGSIPIALDETYRAGAIAAGDQLLMCGFGAGLSWGTLLWRW
jgi:3-oxoacyl-[acyl-carrier-protein] synthase III